MDKFRNKFRVSSARKMGYDYSLDGAYFITICTRKGECLFGDVVKHGAKNFVRLTKSGQLAEQFWQQIANKFKFIRLSSFVVMPNHVHGILIINKDQCLENENYYNKSIFKNDVETRFIASSLNKQGLISSSEHNMPIQLSGGFSTFNNPMLNENIAQVLRWYKGRCTFEIRKFEPDFAWQSRYYDIIIQNEESFHQVQSYIEDNPNNWNEDEFYY